MMEFEDNKNIPRKYWFQWVLVLILSETANRFYTKQLGLTRNIIPIFCTLNTV